MPWRRTPGLAWISVIALGGGPAETRHEGAEAGGHEKGKRTLEVSALWERRAEAGSGLASGSFGIKSSRTAWVLRTFIAGQLERLIAFRMHSLPPFRGAGQARRYRTGMALRWWALRLAS